MSAPIPVRLQLPSSTRGWLPTVAGQPNPGIPGVSLAGPSSTRGWLPTVAGQPNPRTRAHGLDGWYPSTTSVDVEKHGVPNVAGPWVEQLSPKLPSLGLLHRAGLPDSKVQILWNAGCEYRPGGSRLCTVFVQELGDADLVRFRLPNGYQGRAMPHRVYRTPGGQVTSNPRALQTTVTYKRAWLPASYTPQRPPGIAGSWAQVSPSDARVAMITIPGLGTQQGYVFQVKRDAGGRLRALVRWQEVAQGPDRNPGERDAYLVQTSVDKSKWWCSLLPEASGCVRHDITKARSSNPASASGRPLGTVRSAIPRRANPASSAAAARAKVKTGGVIEAIRQGAKLVADQSGIRLIAQAAKR